METLFFNRSVMDCSGSENDFAPKRISLRLAQLVIVTIGLLLASTSPAHAEAIVTVSMTPVDVPDPLEVGQIVEYKINWACSGSTSDCDGFELSYTLPDELEFVSVVAPPGYSPNYTADVLGAPAVFNTATADGTSVEAVIIARVGHYVSANPSLDIAGTINVTTVTGPGTLNFPDSPDSVVLNPPISQWSVDKRIVAPTSPTEPTTDNNVNYRVYFCSDATTGNVDMRSAVMTDTFPSGATVIYADGGDVSGNTITWSLGDLIYHDEDNTCQRRNIILQYPTPIFTLGQQVDNVVEGAGDDDGGGVKPIGVYTQTNFLSTPVIDIEFTKDDEAHTIGPDAVAEFKFAINNSASNVAAEDFMLIETLPDELELVAIKTGAWLFNETISATIEYTTTADPSNWISLGVVGFEDNKTFTEDDFGSDARAVRWVFFGPTGFGVPSGFQSTDGQEPIIWAKPTTPIAAGTNTVTNCADVSYVDPNNPPTTLTQQDCGTVKITDTPLTIMGLGKNTANDDVVPGETITYNIVMSLLPEASADMINPYVEDILPAELTFLSWDNEASHFDGNTPTFTVTTDYLGTGDTRLEWDWDSWIITNTSNTRALKQHRIIYSATPNADTVPGVYTNTVSMNSEGPVVACDASTNLSCASAKGLTVIDAGLLIGEKWIDGHPDFNHVNVETTSADNFVFDSPVDPSCPDDGDGMTRYPCIARTYNGETFPYKIVITNGGNITLSNYIMYDVLPHDGDTGVSEVLSGDNRESAWQPFMTGPITIDSLPAGMNTSDIVIDYSDEFDSCRPEVSASSDESGWQPGCVDDWTTTPDDWDDVKSFRIYFVDDTIEFLPQTAMIFRMSMLVPDVDVPSGTIAWNSIAHRATNAYSGGRLLTADPRKVGIATLYNDWGDLPDLDADEFADPAYDTDNTTTSGPRHLVRPDLYLGEGVDSEENGQPGDGANNDDENVGDIAVGVVPGSGDDEDGVIFLTDVIQAGDPVEIEVSAFISGTPGITATLGAWIDLNGDGDFTDPDEFTTLTLTNPAGTGATITDTISLTAPADVGETIYSRFRLAFDEDEVGQIDDVTGAARSGEVEDYVLMSLGNRVWLDNGIGGGMPSNGEIDGGELGIDDVAVELYRGNATPGVDSPLAVIPTTNGGYYTFTGLLEGDYIVHIPATNFTGSGALVDHLSSWDTTNGGEDPDTNQDNDDNGVDDLDAVTNGIQSLPVQLRYGDEPTNDGNRRSSNLSVDFGFVEYDWGDLPDGNATDTPDYNTSNANAGPSHTIIPGLYMGSSVDPDQDGQPSPIAEGDDTLTGTDVADDEDGVLPFPTFIAGKSATVTVTTFNTTSNAATLYGFIDFNGDGDFDDNGEVATVEVGAGTGSSTANLTFDVPVDSLLNEPVGARFRLSTEDDLDADGPAQDGEIEDYIIEKIIGYEYGDLPDIYGTIDNGTVAIPAYHVVTDTLYLGSVLDNDADGQPTEGANGDDNARADDEDGIQFLTPFAADATAQISITAYISDVIGTVYYGAWFDIDGDGTFAASEFFTGTLTNPGGAPAQSDTITIPIAPDATVAATVYSRFRLSADASEVHDLDDSVGAAATGEVEDYVLMSLGNRVWFDTDNSGDVNGSEVGVSGVTVELYNDEGDKIGTTTTNASGYYTFSNLFADTYQVVITGTNFAPGGPLENYVSSSDETPGTDSNDNGVDPATLDDYITDGVWSAAVPLSPGNAPGVGVDGNGTNSDLTVDFGFYTLSMGDTVWDDLNNDGDIDAGEPGLPDVDVALIDASTGSVVMTTTTNASGNYSFTGLIEGTYRISVTLPSPDYASSTGAAQEADPDTGGDNNDNSLDTLVNGFVVSTDFDLTPGDSAPESSTVTDADGSTNNPSVDIGIYQPVSLGNRVWYDTNNNGLIDTGEVGIDGVAVELYRDTNEDGVYTPRTDLFIDELTTSAGGYYTFTDLISETYVVVISNTNFIGGGVLVDYNSSDSNEADPNDDGDNNDNGLVSGTLGAGGYVASQAIDVHIAEEPDGTPGGPADEDGDANDNTNWTVDFGFYTMSLGNVVWEDWDNNGLLDGNEIGIPLVAVALVDTTTGQVVDTTTTDSDGIYTFTGIISGTYVVSITTPSDAYVSSAPDGGDPDGDDDPDTDTADSDDNGIGNGSGEIASDPISMTPGADTNGATVTDANGSTVNPLVDFGLYQPLSLGNRVWLDTGSGASYDNGEIDAGESGIDGVAVELYRDTDGNGEYTAGIDTFVDSLTTSDGGYYTFTNLISDTYVVHIPSSNFALGEPLANHFSSSDSTAGVGDDPDDNDDSDDNGIDPAALDDYLTDGISSQAITLLYNTEPDGTPGGPGDVDGDSDDNTNWTVDFGFLPIADYGDLPDTYSTLNASGGPYHTIVPNLYMGAGVDREDDGVPSDDALGDDDADGLSYQDPLGDDEDGITFLTPIMPGDPVQIEVAAYVTGTPGITATVGAWIDLDGDGTFAASEYFSTTLTGGTGTGIVTDTISFTAPAIISDTVYSRFRIAYDADEVGQLDDFDGAATTGEVEDYVLMSLGNQVWFDTDNDGLLNNGESGVNGVTVELYDDTNNLIATTTTDARGHYTFTGLLADTYTVTLPADNFAASGPLYQYVSSDPTDVNPDDDTTDSDDNGINPAAYGDYLTNGVSSGPVTLIQGGEPTTDGNGTNSNLTVDFGFYQLSIGDTVWEDLNNDGLLNGSEAGISGVELAILDDSGTVVMTTTTDASGLYTFTGLISGTYSISMTMPGSYLPSTGAGQEGDPDSNGNDNDNGPDALINGAIVSVPFDLTPGDVGIATNNLVDNPAGTTHDPTVDFGIYRPVNLGNRVWYDINNDAQLEPTEQGVADVDVELYLDSNGNGVFDVDDIFVDSTSTNATGHYTFTDLVPTTSVSTTYLVVITDTNFIGGGPLVGYESSLRETVAPDPDNNTDNDDNGTPISSLGVVASAPVDLRANEEPVAVINPGDSNWTVDFGFVQLDYGDLPASYSTAISNTATATPAHHTIIPGLYLGSGIDSEFDGQPSDDADGDGSGSGTSTGDGIDDEDGVSFVTNPLGDPVMLAGQPFTITVDASTVGYINAWFDWNNDGDLDDASEHVIVNTQVITGPNTLMFEVAEGTSAAEIYSRFRFTSDDPAGALGPDGFWPNGEVEDYVTPTIERFSLGNRVWLDLDNDGLLNAGEDGIENVVINLLDSTGNPITSTISGGPIITATDADGYYLFDNLGAGDYIVEIDAANFGSGQPLENLLSSTGSGQEADPNSDGESNDNGLDDPVNYLSNGIRSAPVTLSSDPSSSGVGEPEQADGETDVDPSSSDANGHGTVTADAYSQLTVDFGFFEPIRVGDRVWFDHNHNGIQDGGETGVPNVDTTLYVISGTASIPVTVDAYGNPLTQQTTNASGLYTYTNLPPGDYFIDFDLADIPAGYQTTLQATTTDAADSDVDITGRTDSTGFIQSGDENLDLDMGIWIPSSIGDTVWYDNDHDGLYEPGDGEDGVPDIEVTLWVSGTNSPIMTTTTDINGNYLFANLIPSSYFVAFDLDTLPENYTVTRQDVAFDPTDAEDSDADPNTGRTHVTTLGPGEHDPTLDLGIYAKVSVGDRVWIDHNYDGEQDIDEPGVPNIGVTLYSEYAPTVPISTTTTDANGNYLFANIDPSSYFVQFDINDPDMPEDYRVTKQDQGGVSDANDSDTDPTTGITAPSGFLFANQSDMTLDMGIWTTVSVGDRVWFDNNDNGIQDALTAEPGVPNIGVALYTVDSSGELVNTGLTTTTDANGYYTFTELIPGQYLVEFDASTLPPTYSPSAPNQGGDDAADSDVDPTTLRTPVTPFLIGGEHDPTLDMGISAPVRIGDYVWYDNDRDGIQDDDEPGVANVTALIYDSSGNSVLDGSGNPVATTTNGDGFYEFVNLSPGAYMVQIDLTTLPAGYVPTTPNQGGDDTLDSDASPSTGFTVATPFLMASEQDLTLDMGIVQLGDQVRIGDYVWEDLNANGIQDAGEPGIADVTVRLYYDNGTSTGLFAQTDADGFYLFDELPPGNYFVEFDLLTLPNGYIVSPLDAGPDDAADSDVDVSNNGRTANTGFLNEGSQNLSLDMGLYRLASLGDYVWEDADADGIQESGERPLANVTVNLLNGNGDPVLDGSGTPITTLTNVNGHYQFSHLIPGDYIVEFVPPAGYIVSTKDVSGGNAITDDALDSDAEPIIGSPTYGRSPVVTLQSGEHNPTIDAGLHRPASIGNYVWLDEDGDGIQEVAELPAENVTINLYDSDGNLVDTTTTDKNGFYGFTGLTPGDYFVEIVPPTDLIVTYADQGDDNTLDSDADPITGRTPITTLDPDEYDPTWDVGLVQPAQLGDTIWLDTNNDGVQDSNEPGAPNVTVNLYTADGTPVDSTVTDTDGYYRFNDLLPGDYYIEVIEPDGYTFTKFNEGDDDTVDSDVNLVSSVMDTTTVVPGENDPTWDAGLIKLASLGDRVWYDANQNGVQDSGETGVAGVTVILLDANGNQIGQTKTDGNGNYLFDNLHPGTYSVQFQRSGGYTQSPANQGDYDAFDSDADTNGRTPPVTLSAGEHNGSIDMGIFLTNGEPASIQQSIWNDANGDGEQDDGESGIPGVVVTLLDGAGNSVAITKTGPDGSYQFANLPPGNYQLQFEFPDGYDATAIDENNNPASDWGENGQTLTSPIFTLGPDEQDTFQLEVTQNTEPASIGNYVWFDTDLDGIQDAGESGIPGVEVTLYRVDSEGNEVEIGSMKTGPDGGYEFDNLPAGDYYLAFEPPIGFIPAPNNQGRDDAIDSDIDPFTLRTPITTLEAGEDDPNWDAGFSLGISEGTGAPIPPSIIGDRVWFDIDENGIQDVGEANIGGITVNLYTSDGTKVTSTTTDENGDYTFINLVGGDYYVELVMPDNYVVTQPNIGGDDLADSDIDPNTGRSPTITVIPGQPDRSVDIGLQPRPDRSTPGTPTSLDEIAEPGSIVPQVYLPMIE